MADRKDSLGIKLVQQGFDLWLPNSRGNWYSRKHENAEQQQLWTHDYDYGKLANYYEFSFDEMA